MLNELFGRQMKQAQDATSGLPSSLDIAMLAAAMESVPNAEFISAAHLVNSPQLTNTNKLLNNNNNNTITNHSQERQLLPHTTSPKNRRTSHSSERSLEENSGRQARQAGDLQNSAPRAPSVGINSTNGVVSTTFNSGLQQQQSASSPILQQQQNDLDHHMLRNILHHKKELKQSLANNNNNNNNNSSECKENSSSVINLIEDSMSEIKIKSEPLTYQQTSMELTNGCIPQERRKSFESLQSHEDQNEQISEQDHSEQQKNDPQDNEYLEMSAQITKREDTLEDVELMGLNSRSDLEAFTSPSHSDTLFLDNSKDDLEEVKDKALYTGISKKSNLKRARVENIVSSMRSSPSQVIGCKKRKANPPQQRGMERYVAVAVDDGDSDENELQQNIIDKNELQQKENPLKAQLKSMREKFQKLEQKHVQLEQKHVQLKERMQQIECQEIGDINSDSMEQDENKSDLSSSPSVNGDAVMQEKQHQQDWERATSATNSSMNLDANHNNVPSQLVSKMITGKLYTPLSGHPHIQQSFNGPLSVLQHMQQSQTGEGGIIHQAIQLFFEQQAKMAAQQQLQQQQAQEQQRRFDQEQQQLRRKEEHRHNNAALIPELSEKSNMLRSSSNSTVEISDADLEGSAGEMKSKITNFFSALVDTAITQFIHQIRLLSKQTDTVAASAEQLNKDLLSTSQILDRKSPRTKVADRSQTNSTNSSQFAQSSGAAGVSTVQQAATAMFQAPKTSQRMNPVAAAALYNSMTGGQVVGPMQNNLVYMPEPRDQQQQPQQQFEQNEALSLVVSHKKKRHKVTDTRITPRAVSRILAQDGMVPPSSVGGTPNEQQLQSNQNNGPCNNNLSNALNPASLNNNNNNNCNNLLNSGNQQQLQQQQHNITSETPAQSYSTRGQVPAGYHPNAPPPPLPMMPTSVAIPNPSLYESQVFSPFSPFYNPHPSHAPPTPPHGPHSGPHALPTPAQMDDRKLSSSPPGGVNSLMYSRGSPPLPPHQLHPTLLAAAQHAVSPDYSAQDCSSDCNSADMQFDGMQPTMLFSKQQIIKNSDSLTTSHSSTLTSTHLRKAKLMFFWVRYPSSSVLKMYFPDIKFNKDNTAQLVKWFSNFREFYYDKMDKYARQAVTESVECAEDLHISVDSELYKVLNLHYNRNNHIEVPQNFRFVVEQTLREFFRVIQGGKDTEQSWKKSIYKIISRLDDQVPEYFKFPKFLEQLE